MAQFPLSMLCMLVVAVLCRGAPHVAGGGHNTEDYSVSGNSINLIRSAISNMMSSRRAVNNREITANGNRVLINENHRNTPNADDNRSNSQPVDSQTIRVALPPGVFSGMDGANPFIRNKRQACQMTPGLLQNLHQLIPILNSTHDTMFIGHIPQQSSGPTVPADEPAGCPNSNSYMASRSEDRLRSNCPWSITRRDLGANAYPRYVAEARCLCERCIGTSPAFTCQAMTAPVTYFQLHSCLDGMAILKKKTAMIDVGCFCASPQPLPRREVPYPLDY